jgi:hypothetical protein
MKLILVTNNDLFFKLFPVRVTINNSNLYVLKNKKSIMVDIDESSFLLNVNNGYHYIEPKQLVFPQEKYIALRIETYMDNFRIFTMLLVNAIFFGFAISTYSLFFQIIANIPILFVLGYLFWNRKKVLYLNKLQNPSLASESYDKFNYV